MVTQPSSTVAKGDMEVDERMLYPSFCGIVTFLRAPYARISEVNPGDYVIAGAPYDVTIGSRPGARYAPNAIREQTVHFIYHLTAIDHEVIDVCTGKRLSSPPKDTVKDVGDLRVYPTNVPRTTDSIAAGISEITALGATPVTLGGDHYVTYPAVKGFEDGLKKRLGRNVTIGYIHIDSHMDFYDNPDAMGKYYHGSTARRVSELESVHLNNMVWVGLNGTTGLESYNCAKQGGGTLFTIQDIRREGMTAVMQKAVAIASRGCDAIYVTIDIDVVDQAYACGTGCFVYGGITSVELLEAADVLSVTPAVGAIDVVEVSPVLDPSGNTAHLAATALINFLKPRIFDVKPEA